MRFDGFDWDVGNLRKAQRHGLKIEEIEEFFNREVFVLEDSEHSQNERRFIAVGAGRNNRSMFVSFTLRRKGDEVLIRVISARYTHKREAKIYEEVKKEK